MIGIHYPSGTTVDGAVVPYAINSQDPLPERLTTDDLSPVISEDWQSDDITVGKTASGVSNKDRLTPAIKATLLQCMY